MSASIVDATQVPFISESHSPRSATAPWNTWACIIAALCIPLGLYWDISWHLTIGRDTFWTPAHLLLQSGALLAALSSAYVIFRTTLGRDRAAKDASVQVLGFRGPLGSFICAWGGAAMLVSAPFDNWWHNAYGLDVKIVSPPHTLLAIGFDSIVVGSAVLVAREMNRAEGALKEQFARLLLLVGGAVMTLTMMGRYGYTDRTQMHSAVFYLAVSIGPPFLMEAMARASEVRWARTVVSSIYTFSFLLALWVFPLFPGEPKIGPVYQHVTHMVSLGFPILILAPAIVLDWISPKMHSWRKWPQACVAGLVFVAVLLAAQWPWAQFLMSSASRNWVFGTGQISYQVPPDDNLVRNIFDTEASRLAFWLETGCCLLAAIQCSSAGISFGNWMKRVRR